MTDSVEELAALDRQNMNRCAIVDKSRLVSTSEFLDWQFWELQKDSQGLGTPTLRLTYEIV